MAANTAQPSIVVRDLEDVSEIREVERLQKEVWGIDDREVFPSLAMVPMREVGGVLIGAFDGERMIGFVFGFPGIENGRVILHSDMLAVSPEYRSRGVGYKLKLAQREKALAKGIDTITWTFDPLQALNAHLNISRLGAIGVSYRVNYYGETTSFLHRTGTDRLWVTWLLNSARVKERIASGSVSKTPALSDIPALLRVGVDEAPITRLVDPPDSQSIAIEIPKDINRLIEKDAVLAIRWREATRNAFTKAMAGGYVVEDFDRLTRNNQGVGVYLLSAQK